MKSCERKKALAKQIAKDIPEEEQGKKHYLSMAKRDPKDARTFKGMAHDERRHKGNLKKML